MEIRFRLNKEEYELSAEQVRERLAGVKPERLQAHAVVVDGVAFPIKQAFAAATGLDRLDFNTVHARNILRRLGFKVHRVGEPVQPAAGARSGKTRQGRAMTAAMGLRFDVDLPRTYWEKGFFNARRDFDRHLAQDEKCPIDIELGNGGEVVRGRIDRTAQLNGTARIFGGSRLRDYFQDRYAVGDRFDLTIEGPKRIRID